MVAYLIEVRMARVDRDKQAESLNTQVSIH